MTFEYFVISDVNANKFYLTKTKILTKLEQNVSYTVASDLRV